MSKKDLIEKLKELTGFDNEKACVINDILDDNLIIGEHGKEKILNELIEKLSIDTDEAKKIFDICMQIITSYVPE